MNPFVRSMLALSVSCLLTAPAFAADTPAAPAAADVASMDASASLREYLALTDDQVTKLRPAVETRVTKMDAALAKFQDAEDPDALGFVKEAGAIRKEFDEAVRQQLTPDQLGKWQSFQVQLEKDLATAGAQKKLAALQAPCSFTDDQVTKLVPAFATANQKKIDVAQKLGDGGRIGLRDKRKAKKAMDGINGELEKAMAAVVSPDQLERYKAATAKKKKA